MYTNASFILSIETASRFPVNLEVVNAVVQKGYGEREHETVILGPRPEDLDSIFRCVSWVRVEIPGQAGDDLAVKILLLRE
jgi:hypothetical protein